MCAPDCDMCRWCKPAFAVGGIVQQDGRLIGDSEGATCYIPLGAIPAILRDKAVDQ